MASALKLAIQREEELAVSASTFFAGNAKASPAEFARWVKWARTLRRFPELQQPRPADARAQAATRRVRGACSTAAR